MPLPETLPRKTGLTSFEMALQHSSAVLYIFMNVIAPDFEAQRLVAMIQSNRIDRTIVSRV